MRAIYTILVLIAAHYGHAQQVQEFLFTPKEEKKFIPISKEQKGKYLQLSFADTSIQKLFQDKNILEYRKAFPNLKSYLNTVYLVRVENSSLNLTSLLKNKFITYGEKMEEAALAMEYPNDFMLPDGSPNDYLELIRAPMAWSITKGDPNINIGIADTWFNTVHEELADKIVGIYGQVIPVADVNGPIYGHGISVASLAAGDTDNGVGLSSIGYNTKIIGYVGIDYNAVYQLSQLPNVQVINMSWGDINYSQYQNDIYKEIRDNLNIVLVAAAHNGGTTEYMQQRYRYPASYDAVISVTGVGSRYDRGTTNPQGVRTNWKDVALYKINEPYSTMTFNDKVNVSAPAYDLYKADNINGLQGSIDAYTMMGAGTSGAAPIVSGLAALVRAANPDLTAVQVKQIIEETTDNIYHIPENEPFIGKLGTGRINAYRAVMRAHCMLNPSDNLDLMIRDNKEDHGAEPNTLTEVYWNSNDIWVRNEDDGIEQHQNPEYHSLKPNYVYIRVFNKSCKVSSGTEKVKLYWSKASTSLNWDTHWNGQNNFPNNGPLLGAPIGEITIPVLQPGQDVVVKLPWLVPNPNIYQSINDEPWHFCLLARIDSPHDPMTIVEGEFLTDNVKKNNNIAWKNLTIVDLNPNNIGKPIGGVIAVGNPLKIPQKFNLKFTIPTSDLGHSLFKEAEVKVILDDIVYNAWKKGGYKGFGIKAKGNSILITEADAEIQNLDFDTKEIGTVDVKFHFLTRKITQKEKFVMNVVQQLSESRKTFGGETYQIHKYPRELFYARAQGNTTVDKEEPVYLKAQSVGKPAVYNWYDMDGNLLHEGIDFETSVALSNHYKLEVITLEDGFKDYDDIEITLKPDTITHVYPNPVTEKLIVAYKINKGRSAYLSVTGSYGTNVSHNYILNIEDTNVQLDLSSYSSGVYSIVLISDGTVSDSKTIIKQSL